MEDHNLENDICQTVFFFYIPVEGLPFVATKNENKKEEHRSANS